MWKGEAMNVPEIAFYLENLVWTNRAMRIPPGRLPGKSGKWNHGKKELDRFDREPEQAL
jgi:hypothetical protein